MQLELPVAQAVLAEAVAGAVEGGAVVVADGDLPAAGVAVLRAVVERQVVLPVALPIAHLDVLEGGDRVGAAALAALATVPAAALVNGANNNTSVAHAKASLRTAEGMLSTERRSDEGM